MYVPCIHSPALNVSCMADRYTKQIKYSWTPCFKFLQPGSPWVVRRPAVPLEPVVLVCRLDEHVYPLVPRTWTGVRGENNWTVAELLLLYERNSGVPQGEPNLCRQWRAQVLSSLLAIVCFIFRKRIYRIYRSASLSILLLTLIKLRGLVIFLS